jgi:hypothetical protein
MLFAVQTQNLIDIIEEIAASIAPEICVEVKSSSNTSRRNVL